MGLCSPGTNVSSAVTLGFLVLSPQPFIWEITVLGRDVNSVSRSLSKLVHLPYAALQSTPERLQQQRHTLPGGATTFIGSESLNIAPPHFYF